MRGSNSCMKPSDAPEQPERRDFLTKTAAVAIGVVATLVPVGAGLVTIFDPLRRRSASSGPVLVTTLNALPNDGKPRRFQVIADREDAWNKFPQVPVGAVYLRRVEETKVEALNVTCPHAGCPVEFKDVSFLCPCHDSKFKLDGTLADPNSPSPRGLDTLAVEIRNGTEVWVTFQNFEAGKAKKIPLA
jgi:menaquinol-cytochrome c reductase iron-sulfur subunit